MADMTSPNVMMELTTTTRKPKEGEHTFWRVSERPTDDGTLDIQFDVADSPCPPAQRALKQEIERALSTINALYVLPKDRRKRSKVHAKRAEAYTKLLALSQVGLVGDLASPDIANDALVALEADITSREIGPVKNGYMRRLGLWAAAFAAPAVIGFLLCDLFPKLPLSEVYKYRYFFVLWTGCMVGTWASFASRRVTLGFHDLVALEEDHLEPALRLLFSGTLTTILGLIFVTGMADVKVGTFSASGLTTSGAIAFLTGAFAGISEKVLPSALLSRATSIIPKEQSPQV